MQLESLLKYYQDEMEFLVEGGKTFAKQYPDLARSLDFSSFSSNDPDIQRLIESTAFLNAKLQKRIDEQAPEISQEILNAVYPQFNAPIPSMTIMQFSHLAKPGSGIKTIARNTALTSSKQYEGQYYIFKTTMDVEISSYAIQDIAIAKTNQENVPFYIYNICDNAIQIQLQQISPTPTQSITCYIHMLDQIAYNVYEGIMSVLPDAPTPIFEDGEQIGTISPVGFDDNTSLFPITSRENPAYRTLLEYNVFYKKFLFFKMNFTKQPKKSVTIPFNSKKEIFMKKEDLLLNCTPAINLFEKTSEPIIVTNKATNYRISADNNSQHNVDIHTILSIEDTKFDENRKYTPYFSCKHILDNEHHHIFWMAKREQNKNLNDTFDVSVSFFDTQPIPETSTLYAKLLCLQRNANALIPPNVTWTIGNTPGNLKCENLDRPTQTYMPTMRSQTQWRLISHLSVNYFGFDNVNGLDHIKELFAIYDFQNTSNKNPLHLLKELTYETKMIYHNQAVIPMAQITLKVDDGQSSQVFLLAHVISNFFAHNMDFNTNMQMILKKQSNNGVWKKWKHN